MVNQDYIAVYFCINKNKPALNCNGKCYLTQKLQEAQNEKQQNLPPINLKDYPIGFVNILFCHFNEQIAQPGPLPTLACGKPKQSINSIFHPPNSW